ncbi:exodeoxyribonuclease VII small subunit [Campylobacter sp.]|uniref:exodeoxyribonuclease VII small subunit n=1 Tax=Campylobacter sp. TaxID=205 RepID=UPI00290933D9|nr:exodeoxyribonuclease VII small subunit [Campylobacter sp.]MDU6826706.1 exodeoxyribonuclease VII small subunit [Campylobacter sp.]
MQEDNAQNFEDKLKIADKILEDLGKEELNLEQSLKLFKEGRELLKEARAILEKAELSIEEADDE